MKGGYNSYQIGEAVVKIGGFEVVVSQSWTSIMIADCERWKLSTPECHLFWFAKQYLLGKNRLNGNTKVNCHFNILLPLHLGENVRTMSFFHLVSPLHHTK